MEIEFVDFLGSIHIGVKMLCTENNAFIPHNTPLNLQNLVHRALKVEITQVSDSIIGSLAVGNSFGSIVSSVLSSEVLNELKSADLPIYQSSEFFAFGNVVLVNDFGGLISPIVPLPIQKAISDTLNIPLEARTIANSDLVGSLAFVTNNGGLFTPLASEEEIIEMKEILHLQQVGVGSVNKGSEFVASGIIGNTKGLLVGRETTGIETMEITRCFS
ncbi:MAG: translation initiation factor IF-6 [Candidatus Heimdallarchaeota archaeon]|nr:MAG: translation initiation factor IF-6 [Candidatus Heimdallarchaeota archaeon]